MLSQAQSQLLVAGARTLGAELSSEEIARFSLYLEELARWSKVADLVSQTDPEAIIRKHVLDSLAILPLLPPAAVRLLDLGSGAGFPGLVLAILRPSLRVFLLEARRKRVSFLKEVVRRARLTHVEVREGRAEVLCTEKALRESFAVVITRATWSLRDFLRLARPFLGVDGLAIAMKGPKAGQEISSLGPFLQKGEFCLKEQYLYSLPFGEEKRQALVFARQCFT
jgi:16S rRNA (guanine527-N7)-methyltransferase